MKNKVVIVVPIYRQSLSQSERISLDRCFKVLGNREIVMVKPKGLDTKEIETAYPFRSTEEFDADYFTSIKGYNRLMLSADFYSRFTAYEFMLVFQTDVFIFFDELDYWLDKGYDYVGAPWISSSNYSNYIHYIKMRGSKLFFGEKNIVYRYETRDRVGNGGFSLRNIKRHVELCYELKDQIGHYLNNQTSHYYNEDIFWSIEPQKNGLQHSVPNVGEAIKFSFDINPQRLYKLNGNRVPMAAHGWNKKHLIDFWTPLINLYN